MQPIVFIKYGKKKHLKQLVNGMIRFAPTEDYIKLQAQTGIKGQGDTDEGKMRVRSQRAIMQPHDNSQAAAVVYNATLDISFEDVNNHPVFCLSQYFDEDTINNTILNISHDKIHTIMQDFPSATHALIILEPNVFISNIMQISDCMRSDGIRYFDKSCNSINMLDFIASDECHKEGTITTYLFTEDNIHRQLFCKSDELTKQQEYRFILTDWLISKPIFLSFAFTSKFKIVPIKKLYKKIKL